MVAFYDREAVSIIVSAIDDTQEKGMHFIKKRFFIKVNWSFQRFWAI